MPRKLKYAKEQYPFVYMNPNFLKTRKGNWICDITLIQNYKSS